MILIQILLKPIFHLHIAFQNSANLLKTSSSTENLSSILLFIPVLLGLLIAVVIQKSASRFNLAFGKLKYPVTVYSFIIGTMTISYLFYLSTSFLLSNLSWMIQPADIIFIIIASVAAILFSASDSMLLFNYFDKNDSHNKPRDIIAIHVTYYLSQFMFASLLWYPAITK